MKEKLLEIARQTKLEDADQLQTFLAEHDGGEQRLDVALVDSNRFNEDNILKLFTEYLQIPYLEQIKSQEVPADRFPDSPGSRTSHDARIDLERAISMLPDENRLVLVLHDIEGMKHHEIAERLEIPVGTTKSRLFRARRMIRGLLSEKAE